VDEKPDRKAEEIAAVIDEIRQRVRARHPNGAVLGNIPLPDLLGLMHARDAAEGKVAAIGTVNPRPPGLLNNLVQKLKRQVARALDWHVREQVEFNRAAVQCVQATLEALNESNRATAAIAARLESSTAELRDEARELKDIRLHWVEWRQEWERKLVSNEAHFLRSVAELQSAFQHRVTLTDAAQRDQMKALHGNFEAAAERANNEIQRRLWSDLEKIRLEYENIIHAELRLVRQKASVQFVAQAAGAASNPVVIDWLKFAEKFRGSEESVRDRQRLYAGRFEGRTRVLDVGCGRGELLDVFRGANIPAAGIDLSEESIALCRARGLDAESADLFRYLDAAADAQFDGLVACQVVEHLPPERVPEFIRLAHAKLAPGALIALETPNPECLAIFATHFYLDPTHAKPLPPALLAFYLEEAGFGAIEVERLFPAIDTIPEVASLPEDFRARFFGPMDYAIFARRLG
jgi:2-polyprenyl-3-methyl-5-hydroxy-6-metoxy-1,4-benzoquinol methylase